MPHRLLDVVHGTEGHHPQRGEVGCQLRPPAALQQVGQRSRCCLTVAPQPPPQLLGEVLHEGGQSSIEGGLGVIHQSLPDTGHGLLHSWVRVILVPVQPWQQALHMRLQSFACHQTRDACKPEGCPAFGVQGLLVVCQVHELVDQVRLAHLRGHGAQFLISGQRASSGCVADGPLLKYTRVTLQLDFGCPRVGALQHPHQ
mmetsp:Transcript_1574/g.3857  ORF Transcript_1574/g.3857 Transcript_1574/m.3857 type:complete len:200 (-) Transcript_1574:544-1143(-)